MHTEGREVAVRPLALRGFLCGSSAVKAFLFSAEGAEKMHTEGRRGLLYDRWRSVVSSVVL